MYAIVRDRGTQYRVEQGQTLNIALLEAEQGSNIELSEVLMIGGTNGMQVGSPLVEGARVRAEVLGTVKGDKIIVFRYRRKKRYRRRTGHRQSYTRIKIDRILTGADDTEATAEPTHTADTMTAVEPAAPSASEPATAEESPTSTPENTPTGDNE